MKSLWTPAFALMKKDILLELRTKETVVSVLVFALLSIVIFNFAIEPTPRMVTLVAPGILWVALTFGGVLGLSRSFASEQDSGGLQGLMLVPVGRDVIFFGKMLGNFLFMVIVEIVVFPIFAVMFNLSLAMLELIPIALLATLGITTVGTVFSLIAANTRSREIMMPLLFLPVVIPVVIAAVEASGLLIRGGEPAHMTHWISLLVVFDAIFLVVCPVAFCFVIEE